MRLSFSSVSRFLSDTSRSRQDAVQGGLGALAIFGGVLTFLAIGSVLIMVVTSLAHG